MPDVVSRRGSPGSIQSPGPADPTTWGRSWGSQHPEAHDGRRVWLGHAPFNLPPITSLVLRTASVTMNCAPPKETCMRRAAASLVLRKPRAGLEWAGVGGPRPTCQGVGDPPGFPARCRLEPRRWPRCWTDFAMHPTRQGHAVHGGWQPAQGRTRLLAVELYVLPLRPISCHLAHMSFIYSLPARSYSLTGLTSLCLVGIGIGAGLSRLGHVP